MSIEINSGLKVFTWTENDEWADSEGDRLEDLFYQRKAEEAPSKEPTLDQLMASGAMLGTVRVMPVAHEPLTKISVLEGVDKTFIQYELSGGVTNTYVVPTERYAELLQMLKFDPEEIAEKGEPDFSFVKRQAIFSGKIHIEWPLSSVVTDFTPEPLDDVTGDDLQYLEGASSSVAIRARELVEAVTQLAERVADTNSIKDHDLYLTFKGSEDLKYMVVGLEKVYPELPESGQLMIGDTPLTVEQWKDSSASTIFHIRKIIKQVKAFNNFVDDLRSHFKRPGQVALLPTFEKAVRTQFMAASHFMKQLYGFDMRYAQKLVYDAANDVLTRLENRGGAIALDLNSWVVWDYSAPELPTRSMVSELNFIDLYLNRRTDSFMEALYGVLLNTPHPLVKPYSRREVVSGDDGIPLGTIFQSDKPPVVNV